MQFEVFHPCMVIVLIAGIKALSSNATYFKGPSEINFKPILIPGRALCTPAGSR